MLKKCQAVMLSTNEKAIINLNQYRKDIPTLNLSKEISNYETNPYQLIIDRGYQPQHLYIISDEEIKEGDWFIQTTYQGVFKCLKKDNNYIYFNNNSYEPIDYCKKIIATTDLNLSSIPKGDTFTKLIPEPSQSFIEKYVEEYNKGNVITDVMVEYEEYTETSYSLGIDVSIPLIKLKINHKDNTITIKKVKDCWNKKDEDLRIAFEKFACDVFDENYNTDMSFKKRAELMSKQWIEENL